jgi:4-hydroxybenzoate polyprenyltransferase
MISPFCASFTGAYLVSKGFPYYRDMSILLIVVFTLWCGGILLNDYYDYIVDTITEPERMIPSGNVSRNEVLYSSIFLIFLSFIISLRVSIKLTVIVALATLLIILYDSKFKKMGLVGSLSFGIIEGLTFLSGVYMFGLPNTALILIFIAVIFQHSAVNIIGAIKDMEGDRKTENWTVPAKYGIDLTIKLTVIFLFISSILACIPGLLNLFNLRYVPIVIIINLCLILVAIMLKNENKLGPMALALFDIGSSIYYVILITGI